MRRLAAAVGAHGLNLIFAIFLVARPVSGLAAPVAQSGQEAASGGRMEAQPKELDEVGIDEHTGNQLPLNLEFVDEALGQSVPLHSIFKGTRPAILTLNYSDCPMLCNLQLDGLTDSLRQVGLVAGKDYDLVTVSINPNEQPKRTSAFAARYRKALGRENDPEAWHFLTGKQDAIETLARTVGFRYAWVPSQKEFAHTAAFMVLAPDTSISRYVYGVMYEPRDLRLAIVEAAEGKIGGTWDRILLYCFHYDAATGKYAPLAQNMMRLGGFVTTVILGGTLGLFFFRERRRRRRSSDKPA